MFTIAEVDAVCRGFKTECNQLAEDDKNTHKLKTQNASLISMQASYLPRQNIAIWTRKILSPKIQI